MPSRAYWRLDGFDLTAESAGSITVQSVPVEGNASRRKRVNLSDVPNGTQIIGTSGKDLPKRTFTFHIRRPGTGDYTSVLRSITDRLDDNDVLYLHSPTEASCAYLDEELVWIVPLSWTHNERPGRGSLELRVEAIVLGIPEAYGGDAYRTYTGTFEKSAGGYTNDAGVETVGPYVELPEQRAGWPQVLRRTDLTWAVPSIVSRRTEYQPGFLGSGKREWVTYNLANFLHPDPVSTGDVGLFNIRSNPTAEFFEWASYAVDAGGVGRKMVGGFSVGMA